MDKPELRSFAGEVRAAPGAEGEMKIRGYAAVFNKLSANLGGFKEQIAPGAFDNVLKDDVRAAFNHDQNFILGRVSAGTLRVGVDGTGLWYEVDLPNNTIGRDLFESVKRGDIAESSFKFTVMDDEWLENSQGDVTRTLTEIGRLIDVAPVAFPAYPDATVGARSLQDWKDSQKPVVHDYSIIKAKIDILERS